MELKSDDDRTCFVQQILKNITDVERERLRVQSISVALISQFSFLRNRRSLLLNSIFGSTSLLHPSIYQESKPQISSETKISAKKHKRLYYLIGVRSGWWCFQLLRQWKNKLPKDNHFEAKFINVLFWIRFSETVRSVLS